MAQHGRVWHGMIGHGMAWCGIAWHVMVCDGMVWHCMASSYFRFVFEVQLFYLRICNSFPNCVIGCCFFVSQSCLSECENRLVSDAFLGFLFFNFGSKCVSHLFDIVHILSSADVAFLQDLFLLYCCFAKDVSRCVPPMLHSLRFFFAFFPSS